MKFIENIRDIVTGHLYELRGNHTYLMTKRMSVCRGCPLYKYKNGGICRSDLWINPLTNEISATEKPEYVRGCGCRLNAKTRIPEAHCPAGKW